MNTEAVYQLVKAMQEERLEHARRHHLLRESWAGQLSPWLRGRFALGRLLIGLGQRLTPCELVGARASEV